MKYLLSVMVLAGALLVMSGADTLGQGKKPKAGTVELIKSKDSKYRFNVRDADGKYLGGSTTGYATEKEAKEAVEELKKVLATATYVSKTAAEEKDK